MAVAWPGTLPTGLLVNGLTRGRPQNVIRNQTLSGRFKAQLVSTQTSHRVDASMAMSPTQLATFDTFYRTTLVYGTQPFQNLTHPRTGANTVWMFLEDPTDKNYPQSNGLYEVPMVLLALPDAPV